MAINAYTGLMGSGKSYEAVSSVILPAILQGRNVVTNIDGVNETLIHEYLLKKNNASTIISKFAKKKKEPELPTVLPEQLGKIIHVTNEQVMQSDFFPTDESHDCSIVKFGDMVVIDEAWRFWSTGQKISEQHLTFFRMHRHYVNEKTKVSCDLILLVQSIGDLHRSLKAVIELTAITTKLKTIGLNSRYRIDLYEGSKTTKGAKFESYQKKYDKQIFPLYASYKAGQKGEEKAIDSRQNILMNKRLWVIAVVVIISFVLSIYLLNNFFTQHEKKQKLASEEKDKKSSDLKASASAHIISSPQRFSDMRIAGEVFIHGTRYVLLSDQNQRIRFEMPSNFTNEGLLKVGMVDGAKATSYTGVLLPQKQGALDAAFSSKK